MKIKCNNLVLDGDEVRRCQRNARFEVVARTSEHYPEKVYEHLCLQHKKYLEKRNAMGPDVLFREMK